MDTKVAKVAARRTRRTHAAEFKAQVIDACLQPGVSVAGVALVLYAGRRLTSLRARQ